MKRYCKIKYFLLFFLAIAGCFLGFVFQKTAQPDILLITVDALRADHLGCYGYKRETSPFIDRLAKEGVCFLNCFATSSGTTYASVGLLTGRYLETTKLEPDWGNILDKKFTTLAEYLKGFGYNTMAFLANGIYEAGKGFEQGFDVFFIEADAEKLTEKVLTAFSRPKGHKPIFVWAHYLDTHIPYSFHQEYFRIFEGDKIYGENDKILKIKPDDFDVNKASREWASDGYLPPKAFRKDKLNLNYYIASYDSQIRYVDSFVGRLLAGLKNNTLIILTADHGESLGEHNIYLAHGENIYDEVLHIPLIIRDNRYFRGGRRVEEDVSAVDIVPSILRRVKSLWVHNSEDKFDGLDLGDVASGSIPKRRYIYSYYPWAWSIRDVRGNFKYILTKEQRELLFFLPDEEHNLIDDAGPRMVVVREELRKGLKSWRRNYPIPSDTDAIKMPLKEEAEKQLRSLGYLQ